MVKILSDRKIFKLRSLTKAEIRAVEAFSGGQSKLRVDEANGSE